MKSIKDLKDLNDKKVLLRLDLNVPLKDGKVTDNTRIDKIVPTIDFLLKQNTKILNCIIRNTLHKTQKILIF